MTTAYSKYEIQQLEVNQKVMKVTNGNKSINEIKDKYKMSNEDFLCFVADSNVLLLETMLEAM